MSDSASSSESDSVPPTGAATPAGRSSRDPGWRRNLLLAAMPEGEYQQLTGDLTLVDLDLRHQLYSTNEPIEFVYFPLDCVISVIAILDETIDLEVATVGAEGMVGLPAFLGATTSPNYAYCQIAGQAGRLSVDGLHQFFRDDGVLHQLLHRYTQAFMVYLAQNVACNRLHTTEERCARWLAETQDRVGTQTFTLTQDFLAQMLGVRRATVSLNAAVLQRAGLVRDSRGRITVTDPQGLRDAACSCYTLVRNEFDRLQ
jgi:CRP-like cAMP-binding protein